MGLIKSDHLEERVRKIIKDYAQAAKDSNITPGRVIFSSCGVIGLVESEPTVDAVPVVRCKECKYWKTIEDVNLSKRLKFCTYAIDHNYARYDDDFCSRGER